MSVWSVLRSIPGRVLHAPKAAASAVERMTMNYLWKTWGLKAFYGLAGIASAILVQAAATHLPPDIPQPAQWVWDLIVKPAFIGLAGVIKKKIAGQA